MRAAIYARVSATDQHNEIHVKEPRLAGVYEDQMSGANATRPVIGAVMADARARRIDAVIVWKLDRFGRSLVNCIAGIQELASLDVRVIAAVAEFERELIREGIGGHEQRAG